MAPVTMPGGLRSQTVHVSIAGRSVEAALHTHAQADTTILLLHEALGSVPYWRDFPEQLAEATGADVLLYSRAGQGNSEGPLPLRDRAFYLDEVRRTIPALLEHFSVDRPVVYGHSEGAGLAMLFAAESQRAASLILESPFVVSLPGAGQHVRRMAAGYPGSRMQSKLAQYHCDADAVFGAWIEAIERSSDGPEVFHQAMGRISCPVLALQGEDDEFGIVAHREAMLRSMPWMEVAVLPGTGHLPHRQATAAVLARVSRFLSGEGP